MSRNLPAILLSLCILSFVPHRCHADFLVTNFGNNGTITQFGTSGNSTIFASGLAYPTGLAIDAAGNVYVLSDTPNGYISEFSSTGTFLGIFATGFDNAADMAFDAAGNLYVSSQASNTVTKLSPTGINITAQRLG